VVVSATDGEATTSTSFSVTVREVNVAPVFVPVATRSVDRLKALALDVQATDSDMPTQSLTYSLVSGPTGMTVSPSGRLEWTPSLAQGVGPYPVVVQASDGMAAGVGSFTVNVTPVNDAPSFAKGADVVAWDNGGAVTVAGWATGISAGPGDESGQGLEFLVSTTNGGLFAVAPAVAANGTLTFTPAEGPGGMATVTVR